MRAALIKSGIVVNLVEVLSLEIDLGGILVATDSAAIGDSYDGVSFTKPKPDIDNIRAEKVSELSRACGEFIVSGFTSSALGMPHKYDSDLESQLNIAGAVSLASPIPYTCTDANGVKTARSHTVEQMKQVLVDGAKVKIDALAKFRSLRDQALAAKTVDEVRAIAW